MLDRTIIRLVDGGLCWYPPGAEPPMQAVDSEDSVAQLRQLAAQPRSKLCLAIPGADITLLSVEFGASEKKHILKALPFTLEEQLLSDIDELHFASVPIDKTNLCVGVCAKERMAAWQELLADLPAVSQWIPEPQLLPWQKGEWTLVLESGSAIVRLSNCTGFTAEHALLSPMLEAAAQEDADASPSAIIVYGQDQSADTQLIPEALRDIVQWRKGDLPAAMLLAQGENAQVNIRQGDYAERLPLERWWQQWRSVAAVLLGACVLQLVAGYTSYLSLEKENLQLRRDIQDSYRRAFPKGALVDAEKQVKRQLDALQGTSQASGFTALMSRVGEIVASRTGTSISSINYSDKGGEMRMNITAGDFEAVEALRNAMSDKGLSAVTESSNVQGEQVRARLRVGVDS